MLAWALNLHWRGGWKIGGRGDFWLIDAGYDCNLHQECFRTVMLAAHGQVRKSVNSTRGRLCVKEARTSRSYLNWCSLSQSVPSLCWTMHSVLYSEWQKLCDDCMHAVQAVEGWGVVAGKHHVAQNPKAGTWARQGCSWSSLQAVLKATFSSRNESGQSDQMKLCSLISGRKRSGQSISCDYSNYNKGICV